MSPLRRVKKKLNPPQGVLAGETPCSVHRRRANEIAHVPSVSPAHEEIVSRPLDPPHKDNACFIIQHVIPIMSPGVLRPLRQVSLLQSVSVARLRQALQAVTRHPRNPPVHFNRVVFTVAQLPDFNVQRSSRRNKSLAAPLPSLSADSFAASVYVRSITCSIEQSENG